MLDIDTPHACSRSEPHFTLQGPQEVNWDQFKDVEPLVLDGFKKAMAGPRPIIHTQVHSHCWAKDVCMLACLCTAHPGMHNMMAKYYTLSALVLSVWMFLTGLKIPKLDVAEHVKKVDSEFEPLLKSASELEAFSQKRAKEIKEEIKHIDAEIVSCSPLPSMSVMCSSFTHSTCMSTSSTHAPLEKQISYGARYSCRSPLR